MWSLRGCGELLLEVEDDERDGIGAEPAQNWNKQMRPGITVPYIAEQHATDGEERTRMRGGRDKGQRPCCERGSGSMCVYVLLSPATDATTDATTGQVSGILHEMLLAATIC